MQVFQLKDSVLVLETQKSVAFRAGYDSASTRYDALNADYIASFKNPKVGLKFPGWIALVGSAAVGVVVGAAIESGFVTADPTGPTATGRSWRHHR